jgi:transposase
MYLRMTKRRNADGTEVRYYQLAENLWDPARGCAVAKVIYNFGRADEVDGEQLRRLAKSILRAVDGDLTRAKDAIEDGDLRVRDAWPYGGVHVLEALWTELGLDQLVRSHARSKVTATAFERAIFAMVANRALSPYSKLYCWEQWVREEVYLPSAQALSLHHLYFAMDFLEDHKEELEKAIYFKMADLMDADVDVIFYDTTSLHFEIDEEDEATQHHHGRDYEPLRKRGHSKNGRGDAPQIVVGLAVTRDGLPVRSWVFTGERNDITTVAQVKEDLRGWRLGRCVFVGDAGMNSEDNRRSLALGNGKYILASRMRAGDEVTTDVLARAGRYQEVRDNLRVKEVVVGDGERRQRYVVCHNPDEATRQRKHREKLVAELEVELASLEQKNGKGHSKRACELRTSGRFGKYLRETSTGKLMIDRAAIADAARYDGKWVITSNDDTLTAEDLALGYKQLLRVEQCWRQLKTGLRMRPVFHYRPWRIQAHVTISVIALLLERIAEIRVGDTWRNVCAELERLKVVEYERGEARVLQTTELQPETAALLRKLGVAAPAKLLSVGVITPLDGVTRRRQPPPGQPPPAA